MALTASPPPEPPAGPPTARPTGPPAGPAAGPPPKPAHDWTTEAADRIESVVTSVREKTTVPVQKVAAAVVYGLVAGLAGAFALVLLLVGLFRLHVYLPFHPEGRRVWFSYLLLGAIFMALGGLFWRRRTAHPGGS